jgi:hypothetical protein
LFDTVVVEAVSHDGLAGIVGMLAVRHFDRVVIISWFERGEPWII